MSSARTNAVCVPDLVSTIIPVFNRAKMLREAVDSVLAQTWRPVQIIVVDDGSTDDTIDVENELAREHDGIVTVVRQTNAGPGVARQTGLEVSRGEFIQFLDSDDLLLPDKFTLQVLGLRGDPEADISYGKSYVTVGGHRLEQPAHRTGDVMRTLFPALLERPIWPTMTPLYRRTVLTRVGPWPAKRQLEDWEFDAQAAALGIKLHYVDAFVAETRDHSEPRLCHGWSSSDAALKDMVGAYIAVCGHAKKAGLRRESPEMQRFARSLFWAARVAGGRGLSDDATRLLQLARQISATASWQLWLFEAAAAVAGVQRTSRLAERLSSVWR